MEMDGNAAIWVAVIGAIATIVNTALNRHQIKQNNEIKSSVNGSLSYLVDKLVKANEEIARLNRLLDVRGQPDRRVTTEFPTVENGEKGS